MPDNYKSSNESVDDVLNQLDNIRKRHEDVDDMFSESDSGKPLKDWTMDNINNLISDIEKDDGGVEKASLDFDFDKYEDYIDEPETLKKIVSEKVVEEKDDVDDFEDIYFSKDSEPIHKNMVEDIQSEFEDIYSTPEAAVGQKEKFQLNIDFGDEPEQAEDEAEDFDDVTKTFADLSEDEEEINTEMADMGSSFFESESDEDSEMLDAVEASEKEIKRRKEEFQELDEDQLREEAELHSDEEYDHGDYIKVKDIFKNSKILSKRKEERNKAKNEAMENVKEKFGEDVFAPKIPEDKEKQIKEYIENESKKSETDENVSVKFDIESGKHLEYVTEEVKEETNSADDDDALSFFSGEKSESFDDFDFGTEKFSFKKPEKESVPEEVEEQKTTMFKMGEEKEEAPEIKKTDISDPNNGYEDEREALKGQMTFEGYDGNEKLADEVSEEEVKSKLIFSSREKRRRFKLTNIPEDYDDTDSTYFTNEKGKYDDEEYVQLSDEDEPEKLSDIFKGIFKTKSVKTLDEYRSHNEIPQIFKELKDKRKTYILSLAALIILEIVLWIFNAVPITFQFTKSIVASAAVYVVISIVALGLSLFANGQIVQNGLRGLLKGDLNGDSFVTVAAAGSLIASVASFFKLTEVGETIPVYVPVAIFAMILSNIAHLAAQSRIIGNFKSVTSISNDSIYAIEKINNKDDADVLARIFAGPNPNIRYSSKINFPIRFLENSRSATPTDKFSKRLLFVSLLMSVIISVISAIVNKSIVSFFNVLAACTCVSVPGAMMIATDVPLKVANGSLNKIRSGIVGYQAINEAAKTNAVIVKAADLYDTEKCNFYGMHEYGTVRVDDIVLYAAAMLTKAKGPLAHVFDSAIIGNQDDMLPEVEDLFYEERLGLSGWIHGQKVFIGNRNLLINHNIPAPEKSDELSVAKDGKKILYVAVDSTVAAMLVVGYTPNDEMRTYLSRLDKNGVTIIVSTNDCNVDEETLSLQFNIPRESFKVVSDYEGSILSPYTNSVKNVAPAKLISNGKATSFLRCITEAISLSTSFNLVFLAQIVCILIGLAIVLVTACVENISVMGAGMMIIYHIICTAVLTIAAFVKSKF